MNQTDYGSILEEIRSSKFDCLQCIDYLRRYHQNIGIHHALVKRLNTYSYDELEFFIPQLIQLLVTFETESMALDEFLLDYCSKYPHFSLIVFWTMQAYVYELRNDSKSYAFETVRKFINKLQNVLFNSEVQIKNENEFRENLQPALVLSGVMASSIAVPRINEYASSIIRSQGKQEKSFVFKLANFQKALTKNLTMKNQRISSEAAVTSISDDENRFAPSSPLLGKNSGQYQRSSSLSRLSGRRSNSLFLSDDSEANTTDDDTEANNVEGLRKKISTIEIKNKNMKISQAYTEVEETLKINTFIKSKKSLKNYNALIDSKKAHSINSPKVNSQSMPDLSRPEESSIRPPLSPAESESFLDGSQSVRKLQRNYSERSSAKNHSYSHLLKVLQVNYAKKETEFVIALQNISLRLSQVPKEARLSALRAELSIINQNLLPSEIDIPQLLPITSKKNKRYHKILRLSINDACVLNSAERVPFLLLIEFLSDEIDFNPFSEYNQKIINNSNATDDNVSGNIYSEMIESTENEMNAPESIRTSLENFDDISLMHAEADLSDMPILSQRSSSRDLGKLKVLDSFEKLGSKPSNEEKKSPVIPNSSSDISTKALADQMRIASVMLQQLENSGNPSSEQSASIKARIVESMIALQDQFDSIDYDKLNQLTGHNQDAGVRKLENDFKLSEDWNAKKMRIRNSSIHGHLENWDLCSVIAKNGDDLPQEAFACQLITLISNVWKSKNIGAWTKRMKILITSANTGLVETITNAMSIHSIKKSLTELSISKGKNSKGRIFTLQDYFHKVYGSPDSARYKKAQNNFASSLASYSIICYILQIKDRHNGNIMLDNEGHIIHIDFGFLLSNSPGSVGFESAPFKLTTEYLDLLGGLEGPYYKKFKDLCKKCFNAIREQGDEIVNLVELMQKESNLPCFKNGENTSILLKQRLQLHLSEEEANLYVENALIGKSLGSMFTRLYDQFQMVTQGIYS